MTPAEKAKELVDKFMQKTRDFHPVQGWHDNKSDAKACALICAKEVIKADQVSQMREYGAIRFSNEFWQEVKTEIEKL